MSESVKRWGGIREDDGVRLVEAGEWRDGSESRTTQRARRSEAGAWSEELGEDVLGESFELPGTGESAPKCGNFIPSGVCETCGREHFGAHRCGRRTCPDCYGLWARDAAVRATVRVQTKRYTEPDDWHRQAGHFVASPEEGSIRTRRQYFNGYTDAAELAKQKGMRGFAVIGHPYRAKEEAERLHSEEMEDREDTVGLWVWLRNEYEGDWRDLVFWSPHYHVIGLMSRDMEPGDAEKDDGWVWAHFRSFERFETYRESSHEDVYGAFRYLMSHTGWPPGSTKQVIRWYGSLSTNSFTEDERPSEGIQDAIQRQVEEIAKKGPEDDSGASEASESGRERCEEDGCDGEVIPVKEISDYLYFNDDVPPDIVRRMRTARDWFFGEISPGNGYGSPRCEEDARRAFHHLLSNR